MKPLVLILWILFLAVPGCAREEQPEVLLGLSTDFEAGQVVFEVTSGGCTAKADFRSEFTDNTLTLYRIRRDACKAVPHKVPVAFTLKELGLSPHQSFLLGNRISVTAVSD